MGDRYGDWDAALNAREPIRFKFLGAVWEVRDLDFRDVAEVSTALINAKDDEEGANALVAWIGAHCVGDPRAFALAVESHPGKVPLKMLAAGVNWILVQEAGIPVEIAEGAAPLELSTVSLPSPKPNGRSSAGASPRSASKTR